MTPRPRNAVEEYLFWHPYALYSIFDWDADDPMLGMVLGLS